MSGGMDGASRWDRCVTLLGETGWMDDGVIWDEANDCGFCCCVQAGL